MKTTTRIPRQPARAGRQRAPIDHRKALAVSVSPGDGENEPEATVQIPLGRGKHFTITMWRAPSDEPEAYTLVMGDHDGESLSRAELRALGAVLPPVAIMLDALLEHYAAATCRQCGTYHPDETA